MSTFYIYPLEGHGEPLLNNKQDLLDKTNDTAINSLGSTGLSRILEIPLNLMETTKDAPHMSWHSTNTNYVTTPSTNNNATMNTSIATTEIPNTTSEFESGIVTHSFANRKRSIVKRRKSVLSASFTAEDEAEAIRTDRAATLAALERGHHDHHHPYTPSEEIRDQQELRELKPQEEEEEDAMYPSKNQTGPNDDRPGYFSMNHNSVLSMGRSTVSRKGKGLQSDLDQHVPQEQDEEDEEHRKGAIVMNPNDSAIDLGVVASDQVQRNDISATNAIDTSCPLTVMSSVANLSESLPSSPSISPVTKKKVSSWSPRRIFSSSNNNEATNTTKKISKKSSSASLNNNEEANAKPEKFHLSSLFGRKSNNIDKKKKKKNAPEHSLDLSSPHLSSTETLLEAPKQVNQFNRMRLPIHTERAMYRLSHMKLTDPRRPLHDQVTISNLMFWYLSVVSQTASGACSAGESMITPMNAMTMKACRMQIKHQQLRNSKNKRRMRHQYQQANSHGRPENSNAMDMLHQQQQKNPQHQMYRQKKNVSAPTLGLNKKYHRTHLRSSNSSSEDEDSESESESDDSSNEFDELNSTTRALDFEDVFMRTSHHTNKLATKKTKKYSFFSSKSDKTTTTTTTTTTSWLPSFSSPKLHEANCAREDEDDIPLAMYQKQKN